MSTGEFLHQIGHIIALPMLVLALVFIIKGTNRLSNEEKGFAVIGLIILCVLFSITGAHL